MKKLAIPIFLIFIFSTVLFAQEEKEKDLTKTKNNTVKLPNDTQATGDKVSIKDGATVLLEIENEGSAGSIILPDVSIDPIDDTKLYNRGGNLYWGLNQLGTSGSAAGWTKAGSVVYTTTSSDKVGIGTTNPLSLLSIGGDGNPGYTIYGQNTNEWGTGVYGEVPSGSGFGVIGKALGTGDLINYGGFFQAEGIQGFGIYGEANGTSGIGVYGKSTNGIAGQFDGTTYFNGTVGIGTMSPAWELEVVNPIPAEGAEVGVTSNDAAGAFAAYSSTLGTPFQHFGGRISLFSNITTLGLDLRADGSAGDIRFYSGGAAPANERMRITNIGNVGIGTVSPNDKLHVAEGDLRLDNYWKVGWGSDFNSIHGSSVENYIRFRTNGTDKVIITGDGDVGIGTTMPDTKLDVNGDIKVSDDLEVNGAYKGNIGPNNGAPFPRPAYDSGWEWIDSGEHKKFVHNVGQNTDNYFVNVIVRNQNGNISNNKIGHYYDYLRSGFDGYAWDGLTNVNIFVHFSTLYPAGYARVRIWVYN